MTNHTYGFRLKFLLPKAATINHDNKSVIIELPNEDRSLLLKAIDEETIKDSSQLGIFGTDYALEEDAIQDGIRIRNALLLASTRLRLGIDVGKDVSTAGFGKIIKEKAKKEGVNLLNDIHGLCVFSEEPQVRFISVSLHATLLKSFDRFIDELKNGYQVSPKLSPKQSLAFELYEMSYFESSLRARFLTLVSAVESLATRSNRSENTVELIHDLIECTKLSDVSDSEKRSVISGLENLEKESIGKSCREMVKKHLGEEVKEQFHLFYGIRSTLLHEGRVPDGVNLGIEVPNLEKLVSDLLYENVISSS